MDVFFEQIIKKANTGVDMLKKVGIVFAAMLLVFIFMFILPGIQGTIGEIFGSFGIFLAIGAIYGTYYLISNMSIEYEYIITNGELDIDKIIAKRKRKRLISVNTREFSEFGAYNPQQNHDGINSTILACTHPQDSDNYYAILDHSKFGRTLLVFTPEERILNNAKQFIKRNVIK